MTSEEIALAAGDIEYWKRRAEQAEALAIEAREERRRVEVKNTDLWTRIIATETELERAETARKAWTELGAQAEADAGTLRAALLRCYDAWKPPVPDWLIEAATGQLGQQAMQEVSAALAERAELGAARAVVAAMREIDHHEVGAYEADFGAMPEPCEACVEMRDIASRALKEYAEAMKARGE